MAEKKQRSPRCLILPFPMQGHINPMLQFGKRLAHKGVHLTLILTRYMAANTTGPLSWSIETISDGLDKSSPSDMNLGDYVSLFSEFGPRSLREAIEKLEEPADCIIYDSFITWVPAVARQSGITAAPFFTQSCAVSYIYHCLCDGSLKLPLQGDAEIALDGLPLLHLQDMPTVLLNHSDSSSSSSILESSLDQFRTLDDAIQWIFFNTIYELEREVIDCMSKCTAVKPIGPAVPSIYIDQRLPEDKDYGLNVFRPNASICMEWLNRQEPESVVYVSFGSFAKISEKQMEEVAWGLKLCEKPFLWVVRSSEESKLPKHKGDLFPLPQEKGLIVSWSPQLDVLAHDAVSCFVTHCGWNSTLEALCLGVPMVAIPQWSDQTTNSKLVMDVWKTGVRPLCGGGGVIARETIERCIREVMEGDKGQEMKKNAAKWKEIVRAAMDDGGSSDTNIHDFVSSLCP